MRSHANCLHEITTCCPDNERMHTWVHRCGHYIFVLWFLSFSFFPRLISAVADWMSTILLHMVWPYYEFRMQVSNVLHVTRWKHRTQKWRKKSPSAHYRTILSGKPNPCY